MDSLEIIASTLIVLAILHLIFVAPKKTKKEQKPFDDRNIEFGYGQGEGIELVKKQYPQLDLEDDPRTGIEEKK